MNFLKVLVNMCDMGVLLSFKKSDETEQTDKTKKIQHVYQWALQVLIGVF